MVDVFILLVIMVICIMMFSVAVQFCEQWFTVEQVTVIALICVFSLCLGFMFGEYQREQIEANPPKAELTK
jgi:hypothetical protein